MRVSATKNVKQFDSKQLVDGQSNLANKQIDSCVFVMRAGETIDEVLPSWIEQSHLDQNYYCPFNLNIPVHLPRRKNNVEEYAVDPPLSECGSAMSQIVGRQLRTKRINLRHIFSSPALACVQTATQLAKVLRKKRIICVEGGVSGDADSVNGAMSIEGLLKQRYPIDTSYEPIFSKLPDEEFEETVERIVRVFKELSTKEAPCFEVNPLTLEFTHVLHYESGTAKATSWQKIEQGVFELRRGP
ncbi:Ubiquitin-associated and SH3 domain-containing protein A [Toxocara canis]|uniref:Ubiquitin-associated and SH3 domain-containing protein A n=1 Tax=Toxocara canis TaxID=6265 RepID=A0A0B2UZV7_TOXCA|nr:Ubiquitin-associated and SH3 domain-containing protein A [Toxocara canis]